MRKQATWIALVLLVFATMTAVPAGAASDDVRVTVNGTEILLVPPARISNGHALLPARALLRPLGVQLAWQNGEMQALWGPKTAVVKIGTPDVTVDDAQKLTLEAPVQTIGGQVFVPWDFLPKVLGIPAKWIVGSRTVEISDVTPEQRLQPVGGPTTDEAATAQYFMRIVTDSALLGNFALDMPKGGDLHNHLSGAIYAETYLDWGATDGLCIDFADGNTAKACSETRPTLKPIGKLTQAERDQVVESWSMQNWGKYTTKEQPWEHFFATFPKFAAIAGAHQGAMLATVAQTAHKENVSYLELQVTLDGGDLSKLVKRNGDDPMLYDRLANDPAMQDAVAHARSRISGWETLKDKILGCDQNPFAAGCSVTIRYISPVNRSSSDDVTFAQMVFGLEMQKADPRVVGITLLQGEYLQGALSNYDWQMQALNGLLTLAPYQRKNLMLHAGELIPEVATQQDLCCHIGKAVETALANRIGHGADIKGEEKSIALLQEMAAKQVMVEINLTSNKFILMMGPGQKYWHPFPRYRAFKVPVALSSDDPGVERIRLSDEYQKASEDYGLTYYDLKELDRNSLIYSFLPGDSLWVVPGRQAAPACAKEPLGTATPSRACREFLQGSPKANLQWQLEHDLAEFEKQYAGK